MQPVRRRIIRLLWLLALGAAIGLGIASLPHHRLLRERSRFVLKDASLSLRGWLSDYELLSIRETGNDQYRVFKVDTETGVKTELPRLESALRFSMDSSFLSSDSQWLLCTPFDGDEYATAVKLDGTRALQWRVDGNTNLAWIPGTTCWMDIRNAEAEYGRGDYMGSVTIHDVAHPGAAQTFTAAAPVMNKTVIPVVTPNKHLLVVTPVLDAGEKFILWLTITDCALEANDITPKRNVFLRHPYPALADSLTLSPDGERAAWVCHEERIPSLQAWLHRWFPRFPIKPRHITSLYVARLDGREIHEIAEEDHYLSINDLQWSPDGKRLSFYDENVMRVIPVD